MKGRIANVFFVVTLLFCGVSLAQTDAKRSITKIAGDLYRFQNDFHYSVFLVTSEGIIVSDPINADAARWLKAELAKRFNKPIRYMIYSHDHVDHIAGGEVFADTAIVVAHENAKADIIAEQRPTAVPDITFSDQMTIELGGKRVELSYVGRSHSDNMIVMRFPAERALFAVDFIPVKSVAWKNMTDAYIPDWMNAIARVEAMDFDILVPGHGGLGTKADATAFRGYMEILYAAVLKGAREGKSLEAMQQSIRLEKYKDWHNHDTQLALNIEGMYNQIKLHRRGN
ncbi:MAG: MBL fold metallo-hydrolase [Gammaproteobacteria bacterium]|nr:MBL fold metallo-hydrolase [Pseudomonadota bacterium]MCZ6732369.1 MBL fold metallo-hydrolase [Gammaproteobacteria bacterium]